MVIHLQNLFSIAMLVWPNWLKPLQLSHRGNKSVQGIIRILVMRWLCHVSSQWQVYPVVAAERTTCLFTDHGKQCNASQSHHAASTGRARYVCHWISHGNLSNELHPEIAKKPICITESGTLPTSCKNWKTLSSMCVFSKSCKSLRSNQVLKAETPWTAHASSW